ncbi:hypothetical protein RM53_15745 [Brevundimonas nasdae]|uniref:Fructokinase n=1 Tax=Brevundimonas nasdae TaxID=172043 RepID=A0A0B4C0X0_9CAUL|nr:hypothetical protein [Brevundimonas nasdae]KIC54559.1 hypothetical protein RM53_15745 [Brevundimonas nasdae]
MSTESILLGGVEAGGTKFICGVAAADGVIIDQIRMLEDEQLVLFEGETVVGVRSDRGLIRLPRAHAVRAWTIAVE